MCPLEAGAELVRAIDPGIREKPVYLIDAREYKVDDVGFSCEGYTSYLLDLQLSLQLSARGRWHGPGFASVLFLDRIGPMQRFVAGVVLHELGHHVCFPDRPPLDGDIQAVATVVDQICKWANADDAANSERRPPWLRHGADFVRACCHLAYRASRIDSEVTPWHLRFSMPYYAVDELVWMRLLREELRAMDQVSIREILQTTPPRDFLEFHRLLTSWWPSSEEL